MRQVICKDIVQTYVEKRNEIHKSGKIVYLERSCAWKEALMKVEKELKISGEILFVIFKNMSGESFRISTVPVEPGSFEFRKGLNPEWRGKMMAELQATSGISDMVFCHHSGFIGGAISFESALKMAEISINL